MPRSFASNVFATLCALACVAPAFADLAGVDHADDVCAPNADPCVIAERVAQLVDRQGEHPIGYVRIGPRGVEKRVLGHNLIGLLQEPAEDQEGFRGQVDAPIAPPNTLVGLVDKRLADPSRARHSRGG